MRALAFAVLLTIGLVLALVTLARCAASATHQIPNKPKGA